jgi:hypothetical protein
MRNLIFFLLLFTGTASGQTSDGPKEVMPGEEFTIRVGQQVVLKDTNLTIRFLDVTEDSRCPVDVVCAWAGNARLEFELQVSKKKKATVSLNTAVEPRAGRIKKFEVTLVNLVPGRKQGSPVTAADYEATLVVGKRGPQAEDKGLQ